MLILDRTFWVSGETGEIFNVFGPLGLSPRFWGTNVGYWYLKLDVGLGNLLKTENWSWNQFLAFWQKLGGRHKYFHRQGRDWNIAGGGLILAKFGPNSSIIPLPQLRGSFWGAAERGIWEQGFGKAHWKAKLCNSDTSLLEFSESSVKVINSLEIVPTLKFARLTYLLAAANIVEQLLQSFANSFPRKLITAQILDFAIYRSKIFQERRTFHKTFCNGFPWLLTLR